MQLRVQLFFILFYNRGLQGGVLKVMKNDPFLVFLAVRVIFPQVFGQVKKWLLLELHGMVRVLLAVACPMDFNLLFDRGHQLRVLKMLLF